MILVNGEPSEAGTIPEILAALGTTPDARGIAVAVDGEVVPRGRWPSVELADGARVEVVHAVQGG